MPFLLTIDKSRFACSRLGVRQVYIPKMLPFEGLHQEGCHSTLCPRHGLFPVELESAPEEVRKSDPLDPDKGGFPYCGNRA